MPMNNNNNDTGKSVRVLCNKHNLTITNDAPLQWLIGSPFFPQFTVISTVRCLHFSHSNPLSPDFSKESQDLRSLIIRGFHVIGGLIFAENGDFAHSAKQAITFASKLREILYDVDDLHNFDLIGGGSSSINGELKFFAAKFGDLKNVEELECVVFEEKADNYVWEKGCLIKCQLPIKLPVYSPANKQSDAVDNYLQANEALASMFKDPQLTFIVEALNRSSDVLPRPVIVRGSELDFQVDMSNFKLDSANNSDEKSPVCSYFCSESKSAVDTESADIIHVTVLSNKSTKSPQVVAPTAEYCPAPEDAILRVVDYRLEVICYAVKGLPLKHAVPKLIIPALVDQLMTMKNIVAPSFSAKHPQLCPYHFCPPGILHPVTVMYELSYGETELKQVEARRSLHLRLGLPCDRPLLRVANALKFAKPISTEGVSARKGYSLLKDVHTGIPSSGVSGGLVSLVQGSYEYHHCLQDGFDDLGWGCAYRSLQTIISWFRLQHYTSIDVRSHREIQEALVEIGDKDPSFIGSREWIGAIELSYVLDKLLGQRAYV